jgi:hypothetical protein
VAPQRQGEIEMTQTTEQQQALAKIVEDVQRGAERIAEDLNWLIEACEIRMSLGKSLVERYLFNQLHVATRVVVANALVEHGANFADVAAVARTLRAGKLGVEELRDASRTALETHDAQTNRALAALEAMVS